MTNTTLIYITSSGHSGSTLLGLLIGSHAKVASLGEITYLTQYLRENNRCTCQRPVRECSFWQAVGHEIRRTRGVDMFSAPDRFPASLTNTPASILERLVLYQRISLAAIGQRALTHLELTPPGFTAGRRIAENAWALFDAVRAVTGCDAVVDSSKSHARMKWLWMARPEQAKAIYLVRDGRGVMASYMRKGRTPGQAVQGWVRTQALTRLVLRTMPPWAWLFVRYEDLCSDPRGELSRICRFLSLDFSEEMLCFRDVAHHDIGGNRMRFSDGTQIVNSEAWRHKLSGADLRLFERIGGRLNRRLGYPATDPSLLSQ